MFADEQWFKDNPLRRYRLRPATPSEADEFCADDNSGMMRPSLWFWRIVARAGGGTTFGGNWETPRRLNHRDDAALATALREFAAAA
ncbi:hypothetical protein [Microvirga massiliensis]|uniref:hypothetical protein n=1 Tax=Microvirga massiliensis TaxID=1033741 RepID=UPI00062B4144|nr:hypothetical protein [Microvirga massiliensis]